MNEDKRFASQSEIGMEFLEKFEAAVNSEKTINFGAGGAAEGGESTWFHLRFGELGAEERVTLYACVCQGERGPFVRGGLFQGTQEEIQEQIQRFRERYNAL